MTSIDPMRACGYGQRPTAISTACAGSMSSVKRPSPRQQPVVLLSQLVGAEDALTGNDRPGE